MVSGMALTGHKVICWDENGKPAFAEFRVESGGRTFRVELVKEYILLHEDARPIF